MLSADADFDGVAFHEVFGGLHRAAGRSAGRSTGRSAGRRPEV